MRNKKTIRDVKNYIRKQEKVKAKEAALNDKHIDNKDFKSTDAKTDIKLAKTTKLAFFKQYYTYQAFLEIHPINELSIDDCFSKVILYIMRWFKNRLGEEAFDIYSDISFLKEDYPDPEDYIKFNLDKSNNINGFSFIDFETAYINNKTAWLVSLTEPDNGNERSDIYGRTFSTELFVYKQDISIALGIRESCREPESNTIDASGYRPGFVRDMFFDNDLVISEYGIDKKYAFSLKPIILNGKSGEACEELYSKLICSDNRQMPIVFVPETYYKDNSSEVDKKRQSLLGFAHVVVIEGSSAKLFYNIMKSEELMEISNEGQLIFYRTTNQQDYTSDYYESDTENLLEEIKTKAQKEPCRKRFDFKGFVFKPSWWELDKGKESNLDEEELSNAYEKEISNLIIQMDDLRRDNDVLQRKNDSLESENKKLDKSQSKLLGDICRYRDENDKLKDQIDLNKNEIRKLEGIRLQDEYIRKGLLNSEKERYLPIINIPSISKDIKDNIIIWIKKYYSETIELHPNAIKSLKSDNRNIDWHRLCMMIHYLSGYTKYRIEGGNSINASAAREYDPEEAGYKAEPVSSGLGSTEFHKDKYTISYDGKEVVMDMHIKYGKGRDINMIRIYFYYDSILKKSIIGYLPDHLPTRSITH